MYNIITGGTRDLRGNGMNGGQQLGCGCQGSYPTRGFEVLALLCALVSRGAGNMNPTSGKFVGVPLYVVEQSRLLGTGKFSLTGLAM